MIHPNGYWIGSEAKCQHAFDPKLSESLVSFFKDKKIADFGCGMGDYVKKFKENKIDCDGFDGNPNTPELTNNTCQVLDLSKSIEIKKYDWILSLEVGEHLPQKFEDIFIQNVHNHNKEGIVLSWAIKGQGGYGHYNEQNNDYIKRKFIDLGYWNDVEQENKFRSNVKLRWFRNTIMVFRRV